MKVNISIEELKKTVADMDMVMKGNTIPMLDSLLITAGDTGITVTSNNLRMQVIKPVPGDVLADGAALLYSDNLAILLKLKGKVELEFTGCHCVVTGNRLFSFPVYDDAGKFPAMPGINTGEPDYSIPENELLYCMKLKKLISNEPQNPQLHAIWIDKNNILACDGYRLGKIETEYYTPRRFMLPDFVLNYLTKTLEKSSASPVSFYLAEDGYVKVRSSRVEITYRQYKGDFMSYYDRFDLSAAKTAMIPKRELTDTIGFICDVYKSCYKGKKKPVNPVVYTFSDNKLKFAFRADSTYVEEEIQVEALSGDVNFNIGFDPVRYYDLISIIDGNTLTMSFETPLSPSIIYGEKENEKYLVLPIHTREAA